jgi:hypothetical protein
VKLSFPYSADVILDFIVLIFSRGCKLWNCWLQFSPASHYFIPLGSKYPPQNTVIKHNLHSSVNVRDQVSHQYKITSKFIIMHISIFIFSYMKTKRIWTAWLEAFPRFDQLTCQNSLAQGDHKNKLQTMHNTDCSIHVTYHKNKGIWMKERNLCFVNICPLQFYSSVRERGSFLKKEMHLNLHLKYIEFQHILFIIVEYLHMTQTLLKTTHQ